MADALSRASDATEAVLAGVGADQWSAPTPCDEWNVGELADHLIRGNHLFAAALVSSAEAAPAGGVGLDRLAAYRSSVVELRRAFAEPGVMEKMVTVPFGTVPGAVALHLRITEILVHGWDLARATGQAAAFPEDVAAEELAFSQAALGEIPPDRRPFAPSQPVADTAPAIDRLAACLGRSV